MPKKFELLRKRLKQYDIDQSYLAELLVCSQYRVSVCLNGKVDWKLSEVYKIAKICEIPPSEIYKFFPPGGIDNIEEMPDPLHLFAISVAKIMTEYINSATQGSSLSKTDKAATLKGM